MGKTSAQSESGHFVSDDTLSVISAVQGYNTALTRYNLLSGQVDNIPRPEDRASLLELMVVDSSITHLPTNIPDMITGGQKATLTDYLTSQTTLSEAVEIGSQALAEYHKKKENALKFLGIDSTTGLWEKEKAFDVFREIYLRLSLELADPENSKTESWLGLIFIDLDNFTQGNTKYGHRQMDEVIARTGQIIRNKLKQDVESGVRAGHGEEFVIYSVSGEESGTSVLARKLSQDIGNESYFFREDGVSNPTLYNQTASMGYTQICLTKEKADQITEIYDAYDKQIKESTNGDRKEIRDERDRKLNEIIRPIFEEVYKNADSACYEVKVLGKNNISEFDPEKQKMGLYRIARRLYDDLKDPKNSLNPDQARKLYIAQSQTTT